jgi:hypothetical protein
MQHAPWEVARMYQSTYEMEKLAEMKHKEFLERAEKSRILRFNGFGNESPAVPAHYLLVP